MPSSRGDEITHRAETAKRSVITPLLIVVIGSGVAAQSLSPSDVGLELPKNTVATGAALWWPSFSP